MAAKRVKISECGCDWLYLNTNTVFAHLTDAKGEVGSTLGPVGFLKIENKSKQWARFSGDAVDGSVNVAPGSTYFKPLPRKANSVELLFEDLGGQDSQPAEQGLADGGAAVPSHSARDNHRILRSLAFEQTVKLGDSFASVTKKLYGSSTSCTWSSLPVATEYGVAADVRYMWVKHGDCSFGRWLPFWDNTLEAAASESSYVCFLMQRQRVFRMSFRFFINNLRTRRAAIGHLAELCGVPASCVGDSDCPTCVRAQFHGPHKLAVPIVASLISDSPDDASAYLELMLAYSHLMEHGVAVDGIRW